MTTVEMVIPDYGGASTTSVIPALAWGAASETIPDDVAAAPRVVVFVIDSLGWEQLREHPDITPNLTSMTGVPATTVAPSTTAALTSISTGLPPGEHGIVGYRFPAGGMIMNALRWSTSAGDHRDVVSPTSIQNHPPFTGSDWSVLGHAQFAHSAFTEAHLGDAPYIGYGHPSSIVADARSLLDDGVARVYAYYDGLDHVADSYGVSGPHYRAELAFCDWLVGQMVSTLPSRCALVVTADHGQIDAPDIVAVAADVLEATSERSGEPRFRWLHARPGRAGDLLDRAIDAHRDAAWVMSVDEVVEREILGPVVTDASRQRLGDVALVAYEPVGFDDPAERRADLMVGRHGSLTRPEMLVPVLTATA